MSEKQESVKIEDMDQPVEELTPEQSEKAEGGIKAQNQLRQIGLGAQSATAEGDRPSEQVSLNFTKVE